MPPSTLELLAISDCDDGALAHSGVRKDPSSPDMVLIEQLVQRKAIDTIGLSGFSIDQLWF
jgi:hypothetical protein